MGSKRPDQYRGEAGATDHKTRTDDEHIYAEDKQAVRANPRDQPMIPETNVNPALREQREQQKGSEQEDVDSE